MTAQSNSPSLPPEETEQLRTAVDAAPEEAQNAPQILTLLDPAPEANYEYLHHLLVGTPRGVWNAIDHMHAKRYVERHLWTPLIPVRESGIHITPAQGQVLSYLIRQRPRPQENS